jgi:glycosyltransferase involved in cell wall biosynthesis
MPLVSVIVPIYNVEAYIERCSRALFEQTLQDIEYIFVNDCTPDHSMEILNRVIDDYPTRKNSVKIINHEINQGLSCTRIDGVMLASCKYVVHCDSDDWVDKDLLEKLYCKAESEDADITICDFVCEYSSGKNRARVITNILGSPKQAIANMHNESFYCMVWRMMFRRDFILKYNLFPLEHVDMWEDVCVTIPAFYYANKIAKVDDAVCHYFVNDQSMCANSGNAKSYNDRKATIVYLEDFFSDKNDFDASMLINYWKILAKSFLLTPSCFDANRWRQEYPETHKHIMKMQALPISTRLLYKVTSISTIPIRILMWIKSFK